MRTTWLVTVLVVTLAACSRSKADPPRPEPVRSASASTAPLGSSGRVDASTPPDPRWADPPKAWTDARVVDELAKDCAFVPAPPPGPDGDRGADLFRCTPAPEQACVFDPCRDAGVRCRFKTCGPACADCSTSCTTACQTCKASCTDDACKKACATTCASCKQECNRTMDRCTSGTCTQVDRQCAKKVAALYTANRCAAPCKATDACIAQCQQPDGCYEECHRKLDAKYDACVKGCGDTDDCQLDCLLSSGCSTGLCELRR